MSILSSIMDSVIPYVDAGVQGVGAIQHGRTTGEEIRRKREVEDEEREAKRRENILREAILGIQKETGERNLRTARQPKPNALEYRGMTFATPEEYFEFRRGETDAGRTPFDPNTDPEVIRRRTLAEEGLLWAPDRSGGGSDPDELPRLGWDDAREILSQTPDWGRRTPEEQIQAIENLMRDLPPFPQIPAGGGDLELVPDSVPRGGTHAFEAAPTQATGHARAPGSRRATSWQDRATQLRNLGADEDTIVETLRREGLLE